MYYFPDSFPLKVILLQDAEYKDFPGSLVVKTLSSQHRGQIPFLIREPRYHMPHGMAKKKKKMLVLHSRSLLSILYLAVCRITNYQKRK